MYTSNKLRSSIETSGKAVHGVMHMLHDGLIFRHLQQYILTIPS